MKAFLRKNAVFCIILVISAASCLTACSKNGEKTDTETVSGYPDEDTGEAETVIPEAPVDGETAILDIDLTGYTAPGEDDNARVFYHIFVGSFSDSDGDGTGDLRGIINRLDYLNDGDPDSGRSLGIEGIWLSPIFSSPSYHKYDTTDYYTIDPAFGTTDDLKELAEKCHERGIKLILDLVINHTGSQNQWFLDFCSAHRKGLTDDPYYDFYTFGDSIKQNGRSFSKISSSDDYYECNFSGDMPELNYDSEFVYDTMLEVARYYLEDVGVDGFRFDAAKYIYYGETSKNVGFWTRYMNDLRAIKPGIFTVAEVWDSDSLTFEYAPAIDCFDFTMSQSDGMIANTTRHGDVNAFTAYTESYLKKIKAARSDAQLISFISNHDMDRASGYLTYSSGYAKMAASLYLLSPGSSFIYYGEEIGMKGSRGSANTDSNRRLAMLWGDGDTVRNPVGSTYEADKQTNGTVSDMLNNPASLYNHYKRLILIRKANPEIASGEYHALRIADSKAGGFVSVKDGSAVAVLHNTTGSTVKIDLSTLTFPDGSPVTTLFDISNAKISAAVYSSMELEQYEAVLEGTVLTLPGQTSVVIR